MRTILVKIERLIVNTLNKLKVASIIMWSILLASFCLANREIVYINIPLTNEQFYLPLFLLLLICYPVVKVTKIMVNLFRDQKKVDDQDEHIN